MEYRFNEEMDWKEQFKIMKRWYYRVRGNNDILGKIGRHHDYFRAFFIFCYQLKDGLKYAGISGVENFINKNLYLQLAGDIANYSKHTKLDDKKAKPRTGDINTKAVNQACVINMSGPGASYVELDLRITSNGITYNALEVVEKCMNAWYEFLSSKSLEIPEILEENMYKYFVKWEPKK